MPGRPIRPTGPLIRLGSMLFAIGLIAVLVIVLSFALGRHNQPVWLNVTAMLVPIGFVLIITGAVRRGRADQRQAVADLRDRHAR